jgi:phosphohistidine phosphatase
MRRLIIIRHAKAVQSADLRDHDRPLAPRGLADAALIGPVIEEAVGEVASRVSGATLVMVSTAVRAQQTWDQASAGMEREPVVRDEPALYDALNGPDDVIDVIRAVDESVGFLVVVAHNPGLEDLVALMPGGRAAIPAGLRTSSVVIADVDSSWQQFDPAVTQVCAITVPRADRS